MLLSIKNVEKKYNNGTNALKNISFDVEKGEFISIIGPSGSGKSTLLRSINKMIDISQGSILFEDKNIENLKKTEIEIVRREIGMIFQSYNLVERLTVIENVLHGRLGYKSVIAGILGIARAIMQKPKLLLCDEPIASLDPKTAENIMDYLKKIVSELKITCIVNLHQVDIAKKYSDRIIALNKGEKIFDDKTGRLTDDMIEFIYKDEEQTQ